MRKRNCEKTKTNTNITRVALILNHNTHVQKNNPT